MLHFHRSQDFLGDRQNDLGALLEFDLGEGFSRWRCKGYKAYEKRLKDNLRWTLVVSRQGSWYHDYSSMYEQRRIAPGVPFTWMRGEGHHGRALLPKRDE